VLRSLFEYEMFYNGSHRYQGDGAVCNLDGAKDLLWGYLDRNAATILTDKERLRWWVGHLARGLEVPGRHPLRPWYLLLLVSGTDKLTPPDPAPNEQADSAGSMRTIQPTPRSPFLVITKDAEVPATFAAAVERLASSQKLGYEVMGVDPKEMPATKVWEVNMSGRMTQEFPEQIVDQESWSRERQDFQLSFFRPVGRRAVYFNVYLPPKPSDEGVFFFTYNAKLYVWKKADMNNAVMRMLLDSQILSQTEYESFLAKGFKPLASTMSAARRE